MEALIDSPQILGSGNGPCCLIPRDLCGLSPFLEAKLVFILCAWEFLYPGLYSSSAQVEINLEDVSEWDTLTHADAHTEWLFQKG